MYFQIRTGKSVKTKELVDGRVMADYSRSGKLLGIEMIAPCSARVLDKIDIEEPAKAFVRNAAPREFIRGHSSRVMPLIGAGC